DRGLAAHRRAGTRGRAVGAGGGDQADAGPGRGRRPTGHRPVPDPRCRLAVPPGWDHPLPGPHRDLAAGHRLPLPTARRRQRPAMTWWDESPNPTLGTVAKIAAVLGLRVSLEQAGWRARG